MVKKLAGKSNREKEGAKKKERETVRSSYKEMEEKRANKNTTE